MTLHHCRWCKQDWLGEKHDCSAKDSCMLGACCALAMCRRFTPWIPSGYGLSVDPPSHWHRVEVLQIGYSTFEFVCSDVCKQKMEERNERLREMMNHMVLR